MPDRSPPDKPSSKWNPHDDLASRAKATVRALAQKQCGHPRILRFLFKRRRLSRILLPLFPAPCRRRRRNARADTDAFFWTGELPPVADGGLSRTAAFIQARKTPPLALCLGGSSPADRHLRLFEHLRRDFPGYQSGRLCRQKHRSVSDATDRPLGSLICDGVYRRGLLFVAIGQTANGSDQLDLE